jgi:thiol-disulfide isomerase/thioredoxin
MIPTSANRPAGSSARRKSITVALALGLLLGAALTAAAAVWSARGGTSFAPLPAGATPFALPALASFDPRRPLFGRDEWLNTRPLREEDLRGKVVLVNFWTYTCINSLRPMPYLREWARKYADRGLVVIGVHTPEFSFEKDLSNVQRAVVEQGVDFPVVLDSDYAVWNAYRNTAWPGFYFIGRDGRVRSRVLGEGGYDRAEQLLQSLLSEGSATPVADPIVPVQGVGAQAEADWERLGSGETYVGYARATGFASARGYRLDEPASYRSPARLQPNQWSLSGDWRAGPESAELLQPGGGIAFRFNARDLHMVLAPPPDGRSVRFRVTLDGEDPGAAHGVDTDAQGWGKLDSPRMYQLVRQRGGVDERTFRIEFSDPGVRAFVFTFG